MMKHTQWPLAIPHAETEFFFSLVCGNTHMNWAFHETLGHDANGAPQVTTTSFWRTGYLKATEWKRNSLELLVLCFPQIVQDRVFGPDAVKPISYDFLRRRQAQRRNPTIHVYLCSTTTHERLENVEFLFQHLPVQIWTLQRKDFVSDRDDDHILWGAYQGMGLDRLASVRTAMELYGAPTLVIDGGTALTYTALDQHGAFFGGGILAGVNMRLAALKEKTGQLPLITPQELMEAIDYRLAENEPLPPFKPFAKEDTKENMIAGILYELAATLVNVVRRWKTETKEPDETAQSAAKARSSAATAQASGVGNAACKSNANLTVAVAGGDADLLSVLLAPNHSGVIEPVRGASVLPEIKVINDGNHLCHVAVVHLLRRKRNEWDIGNQRTVLVGQRIARNPSVTEGESILRGSVVGVQDVGKNFDDDWFLVVYDDGRMEELQIREIYNGLKAYHEKGEKHSFQTPSNAADAKLWAAKRQHALQCSKMIEEKSDKVKSILIPPPPREKPKLPFAAVAPTIKSTVVVAAPGTAQNTTTTQKILSSNQKGQANETKVASRPIDKKHASSTTGTAAAATEAINNECVVPKLARPSQGGEKFAPVETNHKSSSAIPASNQKRPVPEPARQHVHADDQGANASRTNGPMVASRPFDQKQKSSAAHSSIKKGPTLEEGKGKTDPPVEESDDGSRPVKKQRKSSSSTASSAQEAQSSMLARYESFVNCRVCKYFETPRKLYFGSVKQFFAPESKDDEPYWHVIYDDDDSEDYTYKELVKRRKLYAKKCELDTLPNGKGKRRK